MLEALIFDVDGTVAETEDLHRRAFNLAFAKNGIEIAWQAEEYRRLLHIPGGKERIALSLAEHGGPRSAERVAEIHADKTRFYEMLLAGEGAPWRCGVRRIMDEARREGHALAIATTTTEANLQPLFAPVMGAGWRHGFAAIVAGDAVPRKKPAPDVYVEALRRMKVRAADAVAFEDSRAGVESARAAGLAVIATRSAWLAGDDLRAADLVLEHLGEAGRLWEREHPLLRQRWLSLKTLRAWHERRRADEPGLSSRIGPTPCTLAR